MDTILGLVTKQDLYNLLAALTLTDADYRTLDIVSQAVIGRPLPEPTQITVVELPKIEVKNETIDLNSGNSQLIDSDDSAR